MILKFRFQAAKVAAPHVAILFLLVAYILMGAFVFHRLEHDREVTAKETGIEKVEKAKRDFQLTIWNQSNDIANIQVRKIQNIRSAV